MYYRRSRTKGGIFFFTVVTFKRRGMFSQAENVTLFKEALDYVSLRHPFVEDAFVIMPDHIHSVWTLPEGDNDFSKRWRMIKGYFTRHCNVSDKGNRSVSMLKRSEQAVWQKRFWEHQIRDEDDFRKHIDYIHYNPVKHGLIESPARWPNSSFHKYVKEGTYSADWGTDIEVEFDPQIGHE